MRDLSLHILDLLENAVRAGATTLRVCVAEDRGRDRLELAVEDDGPGLGVAPERAADPFFTTGQKRVGLGLSLFRQAALDAGGDFRIETSELGGTAVRASLQLSHVDRKPLGDLASSLLPIACTHPEAELQCILRMPGEEH
ncbi:MAG: ATP-binding protein, partial [FCB group bacterium]|nr:ATP-binding protein [FCB group bacterium]